ncbi:hypothetical protein ABZY06_33790 [Streptomyces sp. NPDC006540]|uniref:hypothetical protein n=1 Tax=Streptomyces sp. NPDC006540 TaxID=3155353 RepID=UPI0033B6244E
MSITMDTVKAAQAGDLEASAAIVSATDGIIVKVAGEVATGEGAYLQDQREELQAIGRLAVWEYLGKWTGAAQFTTYMYGVIYGAMRDARRAETSNGADEMALKTFGRMLKQADGNAHVAEILCHTLPQPRGYEVSKERARAARLAYQGVASLDAPAGEGQTLADTVADSMDLYGVPEEYVTAADLNSAQRKVRIGLVRAILGSLSPLRREVLRIRSEYGEGQDLEMSADEVRELVAERLSTTTVPTRTAVNDAYRKGCDQFSAVFPFAVAYPVSAR